jgi:hypothetical protein
MSEVEELMEWCKEHIHERAAIPKHLEILPELPKTAVGKVFKPDLRARAITRVYDAALAEAGIAAHVRDVAEDKKLGLVAHLGSDRPGWTRRLSRPDVLGEYHPPLGSGGSVRRVRLFVMNNRKGRGR